MTLASPDPQAFRPPEEPVNVLQVSLPTNFKVARFVSNAHTGLLRRLEADLTIPHKFVALIESGVIQGVSIDSGGLDAGSCGNSGCGRRRSGAALA